MAEMAAELFARQVDQSQDDNIGSATEGPESSSSASQLLSTLAPVALFALVWLILFLIFRKWFARNYRPRTFLGSLRPNERSPNISESFFGWIKEFYAIPDTWILNHHTLDGYLFLRFLKMAVVCCIVGCLITWPVLFPINITGGGGNKQLDMLTFANVTNNYYKLFAHAGCAILFFSFVLAMITRESIYFINLRQAYLLSPFYTSRMSSRTVLYSSVPDDYLDKARLRAMLGPQVRRIWFASETKELEEKVDERDKAAMKLEGAETKLIQTANGARIKSEKKGEGPMADESGTGLLASRYLSPKKRPTHRLKPLIGKKVDTIDWCRSELRRLIPEVDRMQADHKADRCKKLNSVFVEFETLADAQAAYQSLTHHKVLQMAPRFTGMSPSEIIWGNLKIKWYERGVRFTLTLALVVALIIFWSIPVAFVGAISNVDKLVGPNGYIPQLNFIVTVLPKPILGVVTGLLPVILLAVLMALLPIFLRLMARIGGDPTTSEVELTVQNYYFAFQVVQVFLVATLGSAASAVVETVADNPTDVTTLLAQKIPLANNFYLCYFILQGLGVVSSVMLGLVGLVLFMVLGKLLDKTPRKMYKRWISLSDIGWGTLFPVYTNLFVIAICYAAIAPLVLGFAAIGLYFFYFAYRYNLMFVSNSNIDTKGRIYPRALQQLFVGLYVAELCLIGLFAIATRTSVVALGPMILMILFLVFTALYQMALNNALTPLLTYLPKSMDAEERRLLSEEQEHRGFHHPHGAHRMEDGSNSYALDAAYSSSRDTEKPLPSAPGSEGFSSTNTGVNAPPHKKPNMLTKFLRPDKYTDYATMRRLVPKDVEIEYSPWTEENAYFHPAITNLTPLLWVPRDPVGISRQECGLTGGVIPITDEGAYLDEKNKVVWDAQDGRPPIYEEKVYY
ncbi:phosphate metabolism protein 7 [Saxophila tyrrhenica]|uniref:Phosphate metabolism protein 7 n=1 Tax=Saxophila tyrrhenica TaxID=1690608 RepID=A0AAV9P2P2_9PEZI|nr:phosphate metabolism protein 7 [Saxophila tyrrhenica]